VIIGQNSSRVNELQPVVAWPQAGRSWYKHRDGD
jgi:hypothetical protein